MRIFAGFLIVAVALAATGTCNATPAAGAGTGWVAPGRSTLALLYPGPDGPVATERYEMFREGVELCDHGAARASLYALAAIVKPVLQVQDAAFRWVVPHDLSVVGHDRPSQ